MWRVGRHRLAWRPVSRAPWKAPGYGYDPMSMHARRMQIVDLLNWVGALLATVVVWPWRVVTNRWPVIAYVLNAFDGDSRQRRTSPMPRAEADAMAGEWAGHIKRYGEPPSR
jgi:hypothetical protein